MCIIKHMKNPGPNIYNYNDFRKFLADFQAFHYTSDKTYSKSSLSKLLGLPNTRSYFNDVLKKKKVSSVFIDRFIKVLKLKKDEAQFFRILVMFNQAETVDEREIYFNQLIALNRTPKRVMEKSLYGYYQNWYNGVIRALLHIYDFKNDYTGLAKKVFPPISAKQARESIALLAKLNLIAEHKNGCYKPTEKSITTADGVKDELIKHYQLSSLEMGKTALLKNTSLPQSISTNVISISPEGLKRLEKKIRQFRAEVRSLVHKDESSADRVFQLAIMLFPNSR
jgi:uncharacterized protein (TIGR02147 family)